MESERSKKRSKQMINVSHTQRAWQRQCAIASYLLKNLLLATMKNSGLLYLKGAAAMNDRFDTGKDQAMSGFLSDAIIKQDLCFRTRRPGGISPFQNLKSAQ